MSPSSPSSSVQQARQAFGSRLRELRQDVPLTQAALAAGCGWERTKVTKIESGIQTPSAEDVRAWCAECLADDEADDLVATLRAVESAYIEWRRLTRTGLRRLQEASLPLYERTTHLAVYHSHVVPGLLQTPAYMAALLRMIRTFRRLPDDVDATVTARRERRRVLDGGLRFAAVIEEAVLRYLVGNGQTMAGQLEHLLAMMAMPTVSLGIIPARMVRGPMWVTEGFTVFDSKRAHIELLSAKVTLTVPSEVAVYTRAFAELREMAVYGLQARELIAGAIADLNDGA